MFISLSVLSVIVYSVRLVHGSEFVSMLKMSR